MNAQKIERIKLKKANKLKGGKFEGKKINKVLGNVIFQHKNATMYCDSAYQYVKSNKIDAFGHVRIIDKGSTVTGDILHYDGNTELAKIRGKEVKLIDTKQTLITQHLDYNLKTSTGIYFNGGKVIDQNTTLTSDRGTYYNIINQYNFKDSVVLKRKDYTLYSDTLEYHSNSKIAYFHGPTHIYSPSKHLFSKKGEYHTIKDISKFHDSAYIETDSYILSGDSLYFDNENDVGEAFQNVRLESFTDSLILYGTQALRLGKLGYAKIYGNTLGQKLLGTDTLYILADTLISQEDTLDRKAGIIAYNNVKLYNKDFQATSDSLIYLLKDSTITFYRNPILWNDKNQITADTVMALLKDGTIDKSYAFTNSFIIAHDTLLKFNQIKGRNLTAHFKEGDIKQVDVNGNGESIYYANDEKDNSVIGMNYIICSNMEIFFKDNELNRISFMKKPNAKFIPPHEINASNKWLKKFDWKVNDKPKLIEFNSRYLAHVENKD